MSDILELRMGTNSDYVHVIPNITVHEELEGHDEYIAKLRFMIKNNLINSSATYAILTPPYNENECYSALCKLGFKYAVIWFEGSWPEGDEFQENLEEAIEGDWANKKWLAAGHIINYKDQYPKWHHQCIVLNLETWDEIGQPSLTRKINELPAYIPSDENLHDDYTPLEIMPDVGKVDEQFFNGYFNSLFPMAFKHGCSVLNFNYDIRSTKVCIYPEDDIEDTESWLFDYNLALAGGNAAKQRRVSIPEDKRPLYTLKTQQLHTMFVTNSDSLPHDSDVPSAPIDTMVVPCSGLNQFWYISRFLDSMKRVVWFDFNQDAIDWTKHVLENWDGKDFKKFYEDNFHIISEKADRYDMISVDFDEDDIDRFIESQGGEEEWCRRFAVIREMQHEFYELDIVKEWDRMADIIGVNNTVYLQTTNIWQYESNYINTPSLVPQLAFLNLIKTICDNNTLYFTGDTPGGTVYFFERMNKLGEVF